LGDAALRRAREGAALCLRNVYAAPQFLCPLFRYPALSCRDREHGSRALDIVFCLIFAGLFAATVALVKGCARLEGRK
jgi:hypothetical protein